MLQLPYDHFIFVMVGVFKSQTAHAQCLDTITTSESAVAFPIRRLP